MKRVSLALMACAALVACGHGIDGGDQVHLKVVASDQTEGLNLAARIIRQYVGEERYLRVVLPDNKAASKEQKRFALSTAVVQPSYSPGSTDVYVTCTVHDPIGRAVMLARCEAELRQVALEQRIAVALDSGL